MIGIILETEGGVSQVVDQEVDDGVPSSLQSIHLGSYFLLNDLASVLCISEQLSYRGDTLERLHRCQKLQNGLYGNKHSSFVTLWEGSTDR